MVVWGCGRGFLGTTSLPVMTTSSLWDEADWSKGVGSGSLGGASMFTLALIMVSLSLTPERWKTKSMRNSTELSCEED